MERLRGTDDRNIQIASSEISNSDRPGVRGCAGLHRVDDGSMTVPQATSLTSAIFDREQLLVDVVLLIVLGAIHILAWQTPSDTSAKEAAQNGMRAAATGGLTVAGILIPLSILTIGLSTQQGGIKLSSSVLVDFFVSNVWLLCSLLLGLYVLFVAGVKGYAKNILEYDTVGWAFGLQLIFLGVGVLRLVWGMSALVNTLV
jgi:hypothetical protein